MREGDLARMGDRSPADDRGSACGMVGSPERGGSHHGLAKQPLGAVDARYLERLAFRKPRQQFPDRFCQECLSRSRRPDHGEIMPARRGNLKRAFCRFLTANVGENGLSSVHGIVAVPVRVRFVSREVPPRCSMTLRSVVVP